MLVNIQSISNKINELNLFVDHLNYPDFVLITEHWLKEGEPFFLPQYFLISKYCRLNSIHGGTLILIKQSFLQSCCFTSTDKFDCFIVEKLFEFSVVYCPQMCIYILCIYRPPSGDINVFFYRLECILMQLPANATIILAGDLNINYLDKLSNNFQILSNLLISFGLNMHVRAATRITSYSSTLLDYFCTNINDEFVDCSVVHAGLSDHEAVVSNISISLSCVKVMRTGRLFIRKNYDKFIELCQDAAWTLDSSPSLEEFHCFLVSIFNQSFPEVNIRQKRNKSWFTRGLKVSMRNMRSLHYLRKFFSHSIQFVSYFNKYRNIYKKIIKAAKHGYYKKRIDEATNKMKESWQIVNELRGRNNASSVHSEITSDELNSFYCSIADTLGCGTAAGIDPLSYLSHISILESFFFTPVDVNEIKNVFGNFKNKRTSGWDDISVKILSQMPYNILEILINAINCSFQTGIFPSCLKMATVVPLHKGGDYDSPANFRPISMLPALSKVVEKLVYDRVLAFLDRHGLLCSSQFGFRKSRNAGDAVFSFLEDLYLGLNGGESAAAVFCDLQKAFDCVDHGILLGKLGVYGFRGTALDWFKSYLTGRTQRVTFEQTSSEYLEICSGVPQGSVLGPLLFLIYINDLATIPIKGKFTIFADDTTILWRDKNANDLQNYVNHDLRKIEQWCNSNCLSLNISKTNIVSFKCSLENTSLNSVTLDNKIENRFLGLLIDNKLKFDSHIIYLSGKLATNCYAIRVIARELDITTTRSAYFSLIESQLRYGICFWGVCPQYRLNTIFMLQKRSVRYMYKMSRRQSCRPLFLSQKILTLICIFILETVCLIFKKYKNELLAVSVYNTRQIFQMNLPIPSSFQIKHSIIFLGKKLFNHLPLSLRKLQNEKKI